jgi:hypothetical protein
VVYLQARTTWPHIDESKDLRPSHKSSAAFLQKAEGQSDVRVTDPVSSAAFPAVEQSDSLEKPDSKSDVRDAHPQRVVVSRWDAREKPDSRWDVPGARQTVVMANILDAPVLEEVTQSEMPGTLDNKSDGLACLEAWRYQVEESQSDVPV